MPISSILITVDSQGFAVTVDGSPVLSSDISEHRIFNPSPRFFDKHGRRVQKNGDGDFYNPDFFIDKRKARLLTPERVEELQISPEEVSPMSVVESALRLVLSQVLDRNHEVERNRKAIG